MFQVNGASNWFKCGFVNYCFKNTTPTKACLAVFLSISFAYILKKSLCDSSFSVSAESKDLPLNYEKVKKLKKEWDQEGVSDKPYDDLIARAKEIKKIYQDTHYTLIHAQSSKFTSGAYLINSLARKIEGEKEPFFKHIRMPGIEKKESFKRLWNKLEEGYEVSDCVYGREMLSVDANLSNQDEWESAHYFLKKNSNINQNFTDMTSEILEDYSKKASLETAERIMDYRISQKQECGNLWVICVPKPLLKDKEKSKYFYPSYPDGMEYTSHRNPIFRLLGIFKNYENSVLLERLQRAPKSDDILCPQYRIITPVIKPGEGIHTFLLTTHTKEERKDLKQKIQKEVDSLS